MSHFILSERSIKNLNGVDPALVGVVYRAITITTLSFIVLEGVRDIERQRQLYQEGKSRTLNSKHLCGRAVDLAPIMENSIPWDKWECFIELSLVMKRAADELSTSIKWGGDWKTFKDGSHYELG